jgi:hypothetical protein
MKSARQADTKWSELDRNRAIEQLEREIQKDDTCQTLAF